MKEIENYNSKREDLEEEDQRQDERNVMAPHRSSFRGKPVMNPKTNGNGAVPSTSR